MGKKPISAALLSCILLVVGVILIFPVSIMLALFTDNKYNTNAIGTGQVVVGIEESLNRLEKNDIKVTNHGTIPVYVRLLVTIPTGIEGVVNGAPSLSPKDGGEGWIKAEDGYWYYEKVLGTKEGNRVTSVLYDSVSYKLDHNNTALNTELLSVVVYAETVQAEGIHGLEGMSGAEAAVKAFQLVKK